ncbi:long-chain fatty acid--CoA ligase [Metallumcola ferriviriculae]|uniref:Long-chain fatty acid--CoA ligase n=1 Tax=Metallumcola ferriviriculae TaxID=3039180 RepID=A0AAU0UM55_9FIRM|nr:long-chain fatty acid--CoA ligase [Desulfitibacteraceae bacterium MK1]
MNNSAVTPNMLPWSSFYDSEVPLSMHYPKLPIFELFHKSVRDHADKTALVFFGKSITYEELGRQVNSMVNGLKNSGIQPGDRVALLLPNCPQYVISYYSILMLGATVVPLNPLNTEKELLYIVRDSSIRAAISLDLLAGKLETVRDRCRENGEYHLLEYTFYTSLKDFLPLPLNILYPLKQKLDPNAKKRLAGARQLKELLAVKAETHTPPEIDVHKDMAVIIYTGGTTGKPKGVMLSHYALVVNASHCKTWVHMSSADSLLAVLPLFHGFGMSVCMNATMLSGAQAILLPRYNEEELLKAIHRFSPTLFAGVPTMYIGLINHRQLGRYNLSSLNGCFVGAAPLAPEVKRQFEILTGSQLMEGYGLTEAVTAKTVNPFKGVNKTGSIGIPMSDTIMRVVDMETGKKELPPGEIGEIILKSPDIMLGYYNKPEETAAAIRDGWLYTGDMGYMDEDGYFFIVDRKKDMIITGGFNVYPREVEDVLFQHPAVQEACVIGIADDYRGEAVKAFIVLKEEKNAEADEITNFCREHLVPYKVPRHVEFCQALPKTAIGKVLKKALREQEENV